ncbi:hypothetical protein M0R36_10840 [bacterium]|nr:hypothetical protein [bacterium]
MQVYPLHDELLKKRLRNFDMNHMFDLMQQKYILKNGKKSYFELHTHIRDFIIQVIPEGSMYKIKSYWNTPENEICSKHIITKKIDTLIYLKNNKFNEFLRIYYSFEPDELYVQICNMKILKYLKETILFLTKNIKNFHNCCLPQYNGLINYHIYKIKFGGTQTNELHRIINFSISECRDSNTKRCSICNEFQTTDYEEYKHVKYKLKKVFQMKEREGIFFQDVLG